MNEEELKKLQEEQLICKECGKPILSKHSFMVTKEGLFHLSQREKLFCWERAGKGKERKGRERRVE